MLQRQNGTEDDLCVVITTFETIDSARQFGTHLVESQLAACVNLIPGVESIYRWKKKVEQENEIIALIKTRREKLGELERWVQEKHPYEEPEFVVIDVEAGSSGYLDWVRENT
jgi:periplasmic divalent cation tolerance protein